MSIFIIKFRYQISTEDLNNGVLFLLGKVKKKLMPSYDTVISVPLNVLNICNTVIELCAIHGNGNVLKRK